MNGRVIDSVEEYREYSPQVSSLSSPPSTRVLMVSPDFFRVEYAINPYMKDSEGKLNRVNSARAQQQWSALGDIYRKLGYRVEVLPGDPELPDMVFAANQSFTLHRAGSEKPLVILSRMKSEYRQPEVIHFEKWYRENGYEVWRIETPEVSLEGNGDAIPDRFASLIWGGYGSRTDPSVYEEMARRLNRVVLRLELVDRDFYHLDTCFSILDEQTVAVQPEAFSIRSLDLIGERFRRVIELDRDECRTTFAGNCHCPNGQDVILHPGSVKFESRLLALGYRVHTVDTSEFLKSGGSVYCLKMMV